MGHTILPLADRKLGEKAIFNNRFVVEIAETVHVHYRNLRINMSLRDWFEMATIGTAAGCRVRFGEIVLGD